MRQFLHKISDYRKYRLLEIFPGAMVWLTIFAAIILSFDAPLVAIYFIIIYDFFWFCRICYMLFYMIISFRRYRRTIKINWRQKLQRFPGWDGFYHLVFYPTFKESYQVLHDSIQSLTNNDYPNHQFLVVLAGEERDRENFLSIAKRLESEFSNKFLKFIVTLHPADRPGEVSGKGSNIAWAGRRTKEIIDQLQLPYDKIIVSSFDSDTCVNRQYFTYLTHVYLNTPNPARASYQPLAIFNNNIWDSPALTRVISYSTTFWLLTEQSRPERMFTFSSHSMSWQALVDVGFWQSDIVTEDSRICLQCLMEYDGDYRVVPLYIPVSMDVVLGKNIWQSAKAQYVQQRRWAYGVENFPYMVWNFFRNKKISFIQKFRYIFNQTEGVYSWATAPIIIFILGRLPIWVANNSQNPAVVANNAPVILEWLMGAAMIGLLTQAILSSVLLPARPAHYQRWRYVFMILQWILIPFTMVVFGSFPAIEAQTRLMLGKYLGFNVTEKFRKNR